jgi:hypothetical protein
MKLHTPLFSIVVLFFLMVVAGCGGGGGSIATPAKAGFTNANLNGTYSFSVTGSNAGGFFAFAGTLQANGSGTITGGTIDVNSPGTLATPSNTSLSGTYNVLSDGRTIVNLTTSLGNFTLVAVLLSNSNGLVIRFDNNATASGSLDLQNSGAFSTAALAGSFAFNLSGINAGGNPDSTAGAFTFDSAGTVTTGVQDLNDNGAVLANTAISSGTVSSPTSGRGLITLNTSNGALDFAFYVIDANHIRLISTDVAPAFSGDAFRQPSSLSVASAFPAGSFAFTLAGAAAGSPFVAGGILNADGNGNITSGSTEDNNMAGTLTQNIAVNGTYTMANTGRGTLLLNGTNQSFAIYPTMTGGLQMLVLNTAIASGTALQQSGMPFANSTVSGNFGLNFSGVNLNQVVEVDTVAQFAANGNGGMTGASDFNFAGSLSPSQTLSGTYSFAANGRGTGTLNFAGSNFTVIHYIVSGSRVLFIEADNQQPAVGVFAQQQ